jgi:hypothetical protein
VNDGMADLHIDDFYRDCAMVLHQLYQTFPRKAAVFVEDLIGHDEPDEFGMHSRRHHACFAAMLWLADEGHIRFESPIRQEAIDQAVLTGRMFALLSATPAAAELSRVHGIRAALQAQSSTAIGRVMAELMDACVAR